MLRLSIPRPRSPFVKRSASFLLAAFLCAPLAYPDTYRLPLFVAETDSGQTGMLRINNDSTSSGTVSIHAINDAGTMSNQATLTLAGNATVELSADELASGSTAKQLTGGVGAINAHVRLEIDTELDIDVLAYLRDSSGVLTVLHDDVRPDSGGGDNFQYEVPIFHATGSGSMAASSLRLVNAGSEAARITVRLQATNASVTLTLAAGAARTLTATELEGGAAGLTGQLGMNAGDWRLTVSSDQPIEVVNLATLANRLENLSSSGEQGLAPLDHGLFHHRFVDGTLSTRQGSTRTEFEIMAANAFEETRQAATGNARKGIYAYRRSSEDAGELSLSYADGNSCTMNLHFTSRDSGWYATRCDSGEMENGMWHGGSWSAELADTSPIVTDGFRFPSRSLSRNYSLGRAIATWQLPAAIGGSGMEVYSVSEDVPAGLMFDAATRQFTGTPTAAGMYRLTYTATDSSSDTATMSLRITVTGGEAGTCTLELTLRAGQSCVYPGSTEALTVSDDGSAVTFLVITSQRGINVPNRTWRGQVVDLRVRPGVEPGTWRIVRLMGEEAPPPDTKPRFGSASIDSQIYIINQAIPALTLPAAIGGNGRLTYSLTPVVPGLRFSAASRRLTGAPTSIGARNMTYTVEDEDGDEVSLNFTITVRRTDKPDLTVSSLQASDTTLMPEQSVTLTARVRNDGGTGVAQATAQIYVSEDMTLSPSDDKSVGRRDAGRVDADANQAVEFRVTAESAEGTYYYFVCADTVAGEEDTTNNCSDGQRVVVRSRTAGPDLVVSSIRASESSVRAGDSFRLTATVRNQGEAQSPSTRVRYVQSSDATITPGDSQRGDDRLQGLAPSSNGVENDSVRAPETPGTYYFGACVVPVEGEENTANNCSQVIRITVTRRQSSGSTRPTPRPDPVPTQGPDLTVESARVSVSRPAANESFVLTVRVRNRGNQPSSATTMVRFYRSADSRITAGDTSVGSPMVVNAIDNSKVSDDITANLTAPSAPGTYYYGACVDLVVNELNTGNQCSNGARIQVAATGAHLQVTLSVSNSRPRPKQSFTLTATVRNIGSAQANSTTLTFNKSRNADGSSYEVLEGYTDGQIGALNANRSVSKRFTYTVPEEDTGTWYYRACVEINNCSPGVKVTVPGIDLIVDQAKVDDSSPEVGDRFELSVRIRNQGITDAPSAMLTYYRSTDATITTGDDSVGSESVKSLDRGESDEEDIRLTLTSTELRTQRFYYFGACVEVANDVDNTNNCSEGVLVTVGAPDLIVDSPRLDDPTPEAGERFRLTVRVRNIGHVESPATTLSFHRYQSDTNKMRINEQMLPGTERVGSLRINEQSDETGRLTAPTTPGEYWFYACVPKNIPNESNTGNNCSKPIKVMVPAPDLTVARPTADDTTPQAGESFTLTARVRNIGRGPAESAMVRFCSSTDGKAATLTLANCSPGFDTERVTGLDPSESDEVDVTLNANNMPGRYYYYACVVTVAGESKTDNNCSSSALQITVPAPDLVVVSPSVNDPTLAPGDRFKFRATVRNQGRGTAGAATLTYYEARQTDFSDPVAVGTADSIGSLSPSESSRQEADLTANIAGTYYYRACVTQLATESNDKNNCSSRVTVTVRDP